MSITQFDTFVTILGGGQCNAEDLSLSLSLAPVLIAADGGADRALAAGHSPELVIGDFDSISAEARAAMPNGAKIRLEEQDSTDFEKTLSCIGAPGMLAVGFTGRRTDHELAAFHALLSQPEKRVILIGQEDIICLAPPVIDLKLPVGTRLSLFPMGPVTGQSAGLRWPIEGLSFAPGHCIGTSNEVTDPDVRLAFSDASMLLILPKTQLRPLMRALFGRNSLA